jgi:hypothetical protein
MGSLHYTGRENTVIFDTSIVRRAGLYSMHLGKKRGIFTITILVILFMLVCSPGCIQPTNVSSGPDVSYTPQATSLPSGQGSAATDPATVVPATTQIQGSSTPADNQTTANTSAVAKYPVGSSIQKDPGDSSYDKDRAWVIVKVNDDGTYTVGQIYFDPEVSKWFKVSEELLVTRVVHAVERDYPVQKGTVDWNTFPAKHGVVDQYGVTSLVW